VGHTTSQPSPPGQWRVGQTASVEVRLRRLKGLCRQTPPHGSASAVARSLPGFSRRTGAIAELECQAGPRSRSMWKAGSGPRTGPRRTRIAVLVRGPLHRRFLPPQGVFIGVVVAGADVADSGIVGVVTCHVPGIAAGNRIIVVQIESYPCRGAHDIALDPGSVAQRDKDRCRVAGVEGLGPFYDAQAVSLFGAFKSVVYDMTG
jgi:hypothetical protein